MRIGNDVVLNDPVTRYSYDEHGLKLATGDNSDSRPSVDRSDVRSQRIRLVCAGLGRDGVNSLDALGRSRWKNLRVRDPHNVRIQKRKKTIGVALLNGMEKSLDNISRFRFIFLSCDGSAAHSASSAAREFLGGCYRCAEDVRQFIERHTKGVVQDEGDALRRREFIEDNNESSRQLLCEKSRFFWLILAVGGQRSGVLRDFASPAQRIEA